MIIDASVGIKWVLEEEYQEEALILLEHHKTGKVKITAPDLFIYEIANTLATKTQLPASALKHSLETIFGAHLNMYRPTEEEIYQATRLAKKHGVTVYDMIYAQVAKNNKDILITADEKFVQKTKFKFVKPLSEIGVPD